MRTIRSHVLPALVAAAVMVGQAHGRHVTHDVNPQNIDKQPYAFTVGVKDKDAGPVKEVEFSITVRAGRNSVGPAARGSLGIAQYGKKAVAVPALTTVRSGGEIKFTFRIPREYFDRAHFTFTETAEDPRNPFPFPGDYWVFNLEEFAAKPGK